MSYAFTKESLDWEDLTKEQRIEERPKRDAEQLAVIAWIEAGGC